MIIAARFGWLRIRFLMGLGFASILLGAMPAAWAQNDFGVWECLGQPSTFMIGPDSPDEWIVVAPAGGFPPSGPYSCTMKSSLRIESVNWAKADPDLDLIRDHPRFKAMLAAAEARLAQSQH